jgi:inhibitor of KinA
MRGDQLCARMEIIPLGDSAVIVRLRVDFESAPQESLAATLQATRRLEAAHLPGVLELVPAYTTVAVFYDPARLIDEGAEPKKIVDWISQKIRQILAEKIDTEASDVRTIEIPVCYDTEFGVDLDDVARHTGLDAGEVIQRHASADYRVACIGFAPGFPFLSGLPPELAVPRRASPRKEVPAGSVAIGGAQTGVYPRRSPGGWNIIGGTPIRLFDITANPPSLLQPGDRVKFRSITREEFSALSK